MDRLPVEFHPDAAAEAADWYAERSQKAADEFLEELEVARRAIEQHPERWATYLFGTRRYLAKVFPFVIVYRIAASRIEIIAVAHGRRKPGFWKSRLRTK